MTPKTINTDERVFEVTNFEDETYLCNLGHFTLGKRGNLTGANGEEIKRLRHYWNNNLTSIGKVEVKEMLEATIPTVKFARVCSITGEGMNEGYCILDGEMYIKDHMVMVQHITDDTDYADIDEAYEDDYFYYTEWEEDDNN